MDQLTRAAAISSLRQRLIDAMNMRRFSRETQRNYIRDIGRFASVLGRSPRTATAEDVRRFPIEQHDSGVPTPTMHSIVSALRVLFTSTLDRPDLAHKLVRVAHLRNLPVVLGRQEVARLLAATTCLKHQAALSVAYGAGLHAAEVAALKVADIGSERMLIRVKRATCRFHHLRDTTASACLLDLRLTAYSNIATVNRLTGGEVVAGVRDVAAAARVSVATVSRYLNGKLVLPPDTAARIDDARTRLNYQANPHARRLSRGRADTLGLVIPDIANPFFAVLADTIQREAEAEGLEVLIAATRNQPDREVAVLDRLGRKGTDGVLFVTNHADDGALARALRAIPSAVLLDEDVAGTAMPKLFADNVGGGRLAADHLLAHGHRRVGILGGPTGLLSAEERHRGFRDRMEEGGGAVVFTDRGDYTIEAGRRGADAMLAMASPPTAVFAASDQTALGVLDAARIRGVPVPGTLSLIGFDDIGPWHLLNPALTVIRQPVEELGRRGVQLLLATIAGTVSDSPQRLPVELVVRASVAPPRERRS